MGGSTRTDAQGKFQLAGFPITSAQRLIIENKKQNVRGHVEVPALAAGDVPPKRTERVEVKLQAGGRVVGQILTDGDRPLSGAPVMLYENARDEAGNGIGRPTMIESRTDEQGRYTLAPVEPGRSYYLNVDHDPYEKTLSVREFNVEAGATYEHKTLTLRKLVASISGIVVDPAGHPVEGATIAASDQKTQHPISLYKGQGTVSGSDGRFTIRHLPDAAISLMAYLSPRSEGNDNSIRFPATIDVKPGETDVRIVLDPKLSRRRVIRAKPGQALIEKRDGPPGQLPKAEKPSGN